MARPITLNGTVHDPKAELRRRLDEAPVEHAEALLAAYEVLQGLHDRGALELMRGALGSTDEVLEIAVDAAKSPHAIRSLRNLVQLANLLGEIDPDQLRQLTKPVPETINAGPNSDPPGWLKMLGLLLWNKDLRRAMWKGATFLETIGKNLAKPPTKPI